MNRFLAIVIGLLFICAAAYEVKRGVALYDRFGLMRVERKKEPVGFWIAIGAQIAMGVTAVLYGFGILQ
jgi:heme A synthase